MCRRLLLRVLSTIVNDWSNVHFKIKTLPIYPCRRQIQLILAGCYHKCSITFGQSLMVILSPLCFGVPSGNLGNLTAGVMAHLSGMPVHQFIAAHNRNDFFPQFIAGENAAFKASVHTPSSAMDVGAPSNFERLKSMLSPEIMRKKIWATSVSDEATLETMKRLYEKTGYLADPHTAVGVESIRRYRAATGSEHPCVVLATAHPAKFPEIVKKAIGIEPATPRSLMELALRPKCAVPIPATYEAFREAISQNVR